MTQIKPFNAITYNQEKVKNLADVVCPPYDVISAEQQAKYHSQSSHNFIHVLLGKDKSKDDERENKYTRAQKIFEKWIREDVMKEDEKPCIYFYEQEYKVLGQTRNRLGFIARMRLQDDEDSTIYPHENTHDRAINDRFRLWKLLKCNLSPIFVCFSDKSKRVETIFKKNLAVSEPFIDIIDDDHVRHSVWRLDDPDLIKEIEATIENQHVFIADGHHRYKVAQQYRNSKAKNKAKLDKDAPYNYLMTYFTNMDSKDLQIFPIHRIIKKLPGPLDFLEDFFRIDKIRTKEELLILLAKAGINEYAFGLYTREGMKLLRLKNKLLIDEHIKEGSEEYRKLDATILKNFVFDRLSIPSEDITYTKDFQEAADVVDNNEADASFIMNAVKIQQIRSVALNGERMPPKTTYFYPKVLSGLTINKVE